jgi:GH24 family phage-related lysozyme (muramidase)
VSLIFNAEQWTEHFARFEGKVDHFYLDGEGLVTIGIGCQIFIPQELPMISKTAGGLATRQDIQADFDAVKALEAGRAPAYYDRVCRLRMTDAAIVYLFNSRLNSMIQKVCDTVVDLSQFPEPAALAVIDMAFNLGVAGLTHKFPKFLNAFLAKDWKTCSLECKREGIQKERNEWTRAVFDGLS